MAPLSTQVRHLTKDHILIVPAANYYITTFNIGAAGGDVEALVACNDGSETIRLLIAGPAPDQKMSITRLDDGGVSIIYSPNPKEEK
jgi:hypothetical protein